MLDTATFKDIYIRLLVRAWSDDAYRQVVLTAPHQSLTEVGFDLPADATVRIEENSFSEYEEPSLDRAAEVWNEGYTTGVFRLSLPASSPVDLVELKDEELQGLAGGFCCSCCCG